MITIIIPKTGDVDSTIANISELLFCCIHMYLMLGYLRINIQVCKNDIGDVMQQHRMLQQKFHKKKKQVEIIPITCTRLIDLHGLIKK